MDTPYDILPFKRPQLVSLLTDFGNKDYYVASLKGQILQIQAPILLVDISHEIDIHDIVKASFFIHNCFEDFPVNSIHVVAVNNYYSDIPELICFQYKGHYFIGPNNGLFSLYFNDINEQSIRLIEDQTKQSFSLNQKISLAIKYIIEKNRISDLGIKLQHYDQKLGIQPVFSHDEIRASVIHIDHYENVIINLKKEAFEKFRNGRDFSIYIKPTDPIINICKSYAEVNVGDPLCIYNEAGYLTIAINIGKASSMYSLFRNDTIQILFYS